MSGAAVFSGAILVDDNSTATIEGESTFADNSAAGYGGERHVRAFVFWSYVVNQSTRKTIRAGAQMHFHEIIDEPRWLACSQI